MVNYKDLGLVNTRDMFARAINGGYAIPAFNFNNMEQMQAIIKAAVETKSPVILQVSKGARNYANATLLRYMAQFGGALKAAIGIPEEQLRKAAKSAVCKINIDSDSRLAMTAAVRKVFAEKPAEFDPRKYLGPARDNMEKLYKHKIINVLGSDGKLVNC